MLHFASVPRPMFGLPAILSVAFVAAMPARADLAWHPDLPTALSASATSGKPVLVMFHAAWGDDASVAAENVLASSEVEAVVGACFEPVRLDADQHADEANELGIEHVPAACVLNADREPLTSFECPDSPAAFVAAAARAAQLAAAANQPNPAADASAQTLAHDAFSDAAARPSNAAIAAVSSKVRQLSNFAEGSGGSTLASPRYADTAGSSFAPAAAATSGTDYRVAPSAPTLARTPPSWPAEQPDSSLTSFQPDQSPPTADRQATAPAVLGNPAQAEAEAQPRFQPQVGRFGQTDPAPTPDILPQPQPAGRAQPDAATPWLASTPSAASPTAAEPAPTGDPAATAEPTAAAETPAAAVEASKPNAFLAALQKPWSIFSKSSTKPAIEPPAPPPTMPPALPKLAASLAGTPPTAAPDTHGPMPLGLEGYCPVTVVERGSWVEGRPQWGARHRGRTYLFAGPEQQQAFLADPDRYAPALSGDDPVLAFEGGRSEPGRRAYGVSYQSRMYLFASPETRTAFTADPDRFTTRVMIAEGIAPADGARRF